MWLQLNKFKGFQGLAGTNFYKYRFMHIAQKYRLFFDILSKSTKFVKLC